MTANAHAFNNDFLISHAGEINHEFIRWSAAQRAISASDIGKPSDKEVAYWVEKLTGMAEMARTRFMREASADVSRRFSVSALIGQCESLAASGDLKEPAERSLRLLIAKTLAAYGMPSKHERAHAEIEITPAGQAAMAEFEQANCLELQLQAVHHEMGAT